eukprot:CAMPEP_0184693990 /NCGR_PEP_ID=MMETSP0313-20130426/2072_1 /TAXON_ID=2792 /ORGANISM="Porphyridium aerugineum, Strain SAG 1380-2" /LENGTH=378 /DNA_ID=CAMNT_0027152191 /DNA_START=17 /DNA_END=1153 /DNA_ORIENTATION=-
MRTTFSSSSSSDLSRTSTTSSPKSLNTSFRNWWPMNEEEYCYAVSTGSVPSPNWNAPKALGQAQSSSETFNHTRASGIPVSTMYDPKSSTMDSKFSSNRPYPYSSANSSMATTTDARFSTAKNDPYRSSPYGNTLQSSTFSSSGPGMKGKDWWPMNEDEYLEVIGMSSTTSSGVSNPALHSTWSSSPTPVNTSITKPMNSSDARTEYIVQGVSKPQKDILSWSSSPLSSPPPPAPPSASSSSSTIASSKMLTDDESQDMIIEKKSDGRLPVRNNAINAAYISPSGIAGQNIGKIPESGTPERNGTNNDSLLSKASKWSSSARVSQFATPIRASRQTDERVVGYLGDDNDNDDDDDDDNHDDDDDDDGQSDEEPMDEPF